MIESFLKEFFSDIPEGVFFYLWSLPDKRSQWFQGPKGIEEASKYAERIKDEKDVYVGCTLSPKNFGLYKRVESRNSCGLVGLWADIDIAHDVHSETSLPRTVEEAMSFLEDDIKAPPTYIINSGHGLQVWWLFDEPLIFESEEERQEGVKLAGTWVYSYKLRGAKKGWSFDSVIDLSRVLRIPGTYNHKEEGNSIPVEVIEYNEDARYSIDDISQYILDQAWDDYANKKIKVAGVVENVFVLDPKAEPPSDKMSILLEIEPGFRASWNRRNKKLTQQTPSNYDAALANYAYLAGWSDQDIVNLLIANRRKNGDDLKLREDYYDRTLSFAKTNHEKQETRQQVIEEMEAVAESDIPEEDKKQHFVQQLCEVLEVPITRIVKYTTDPPEYTLETTLGKVRLGDAGGVIEQKRMRKAVAATCGKMIPRFKVSEWDPIAQILLNACVDVDAGKEATESGQVQVWIADYLESKPPAEDMDEKEDALITNRPFIENGAVYIFGNDLRKWIHRVQGERITNKQIGVMLTSAGCESTKLNITLNGRRTTRNVWVVPKSLRG